jgi:hypothetical protein
MDQHVQERLAANEDTFRQVNEGIARGQWPGEDRKPVSFRCECARLGCNLLIELSLAEYEAIRGYSRRFLVVDGHELPKVEAVIERRDGYVVVEKGGEAGELAERLDPRS